MHALDGKLLRPLLLHVTMSSWLMFFQALAVCLTNPKITD